MNQKESNKQPPKRKPILNLIYFVDSKETHTLKIPLKGFYLIVITSLFLVFWAGLSGYLATRFIRNQITANDRIKSLAESVFQYQTKYDQVYEKAYPTEDSQPGYPTLTTSEGFFDQVSLPDKIITNTSTDQSNDQLSLSSLSSADAENLEPGVTKRKAPSPPKDSKNNRPEESVELSNSQEDTPTAFPASVEKLEVESSSNTLLARFNIKNLRKPNKTIGYVWSTAVFKTKKGKLIQLAMPKGLKANADGSPEDYAEAYRFMIRYFKKHQFKFPAPEGVEGRFQSLRIFLANKKKTQVESYDRTLDGTKKSS